MESNKSQFTAEELEQLQEQTFLEQVDFHTEIDSTNTRAIQLCAKGDLQTPQLVLAERQTSGRGRGKNQWWAQPGCLTFSVILDITSFSKQEQLPLISLATGWAISSTIAKYALPSTIRVKWPNDIYLNECKVCGILTETAGAKFVVVGVGLNVNNSFANAPDQLKSKASSLFDEVGQEFPLTEVLAELLQQMELEWSKLAAGDLSFLDDWQQRCLLTGRMLTHQAGEKLTTGYCQGIDETGALLLRTERKLERLIGGTIIEF